MINNSPEDPFRPNYTSFRPIYQQHFVKLVFYEVFTLCLPLSPSQLMMIILSFLMIIFIMLSYRINPKDHLLRPDLSILAEHFVLKPNIDHISISKEP